MKLSISLLALMPSSRRSQSSCGSRSYRSGSTYTGSQTSRTASRSGSSYYSASQSGRGDQHRQHGSSRASEVSRGSQSTRGSRGSQSSRGGKQSGYNEQRRPESVASSHGYQSGFIPIQDLPAAGGERNPNRDYRPKWKDSNRNPLGVLSTASEDANEMGYPYQSSERSFKSGSSRRSQSEKPMYVIPAHGRSQLQPGQLGRSHQMNERTMSVPKGGCFAGESTYRRTFFDRSQMFDSARETNRRPRVDSDAHHATPLDPMSGQPMQYLPFEGESWSHMVHSQRALQGEKIWVYEPPARLYDVVFGSENGRVLY